MTLTRTILALLAIGFAGLIWWAIANGNFAEEGNWLVSNPWGIVSLVDLYIGFFLTAIIIAGFERPLHAALWILPLPFLGNVWALIWFVLRLPTLWQRLRAS